MKQIYLMGVHMVNNEGRRHLIYSGRHIGSEDLIGTIQIEDENIVVTKKNNQIKLRRFLKDNNRIHYIAEEHPMTFDTEEQQLIKEKLEELKSQNISIESLGLKQGEPITNYVIYLLSNNHYDHLSNLRKLNNNTSFDTLLYKDHLEKKAKELELIKQAKVSHPKTRIRAKN